MSPDVSVATTSGAESTVCKSALEYAQRGWKVFPLAQGQKKPAFTGWQEKATTDPGTIKKWWGCPGLYEFNGIGIVTGASSGIWVLDLDVKNPESNGLRGFENLIQHHQGLTAPLVAKTPSGGRHFYFSHPGIHVPQKVALLPGIDVRGDGGFIVAPPTRLNGGAYTWMSPLKPTEVAPQWLMDMVTAVDAIRQETVITDGQIKPGSRYITLRNLRCSLRAKGIPEDLIEGVVRGVNQQCTGNQPLDDLELKTVMQVPNDIPNPILKIAKPKCEIRISSPVEVITQQIVTTIEKSNSPPQFFVRDGYPYRIVKNELGRFVLQRLTEDRVKYEVSRLCTFLKDVTDRTTKQKFSTECSVSDAIIKDLLASPLLPFPAFAGFTETPFVTPSGKTVSSEGYNAETQLYYAPCTGLTIGDISEDPSDDEIHAAFALLEEIICDFPFETQADKENCIAALIHPVLRPTVRTYVPIVLIDKPQPGVGASLISDVMSIVATGFLANKQSEAPNNDEWEKRIDSILRAGRVIAIVDNVHHTLQSSALAAVVTMDSKDVRIFGKTWVEKIQNKTLWIINGNNVAVSEEIARRCFRVRMDSPSSKPWQRNEDLFRHPDLIGWVTDNRAKILTAILTIIRAAITRKTEVGASVPRMGSFREWRTLMGGIMAMGGYEQFLTNLDKLYEDADTDLPEWNTFFEQWFSARGQKPQTAKEIKEMVESSLLMRNAMPDQLQDAFNKGSFTNAVGKALKGIKDVKFPTGFTLKIGTVLHGNQRYYVQKMTEQPAMS